MRERGTRWLVLERLLVNDWRFGEREGSLSYVMFFAEILGFERLRIVHAKRRL